MPVSSLITLIVVFFVTSVVGVVTGSNSLIAVPVMFQVGIDPRVAVATNMFALVFMSVGGTIPFLRTGTIKPRPLLPLIGITLVSSAIGALLVGIIPVAGIKLIVSAAMIAVVLFTVWKRKAGTDVPQALPAYAVPATFIFTFLLGIYGGLFSGGYVTVLTTVFVGFAGMRYSEAVASTKLINVFSSSVATAVFMWQGLVDYRLGIILGLTMFVGAYVGAHYVTKVDDIWIRRVFLATVVLLALKTLIDLIT
jgi:uncharacterized membrane protein YfcA